MGNMVVHHLVHNKKILAHIKFQQARVKFKEAVILSHLTLN